MRLLRNPITWILALIAVAALVLTTVFVFRQGGETEIGAGVKVHSTKLRDHLKAKTAKAEWPLSRELAETVTNFYEIGPSGQLPADMSVRLPSRVKLSGAGDGYMFMVLTAESPDGPWKPLPTTVAPDGKSLVAQTNHLSIFVGVRIWLGKVVSGIDAARNSVLAILKQTFNGLTDDLFAQAEAPKCAGQDEARKDGYNVAASGGDKKTVLWCFGLEKGQRVLKLVNNRRYSLLGDHPGLTVMDDGPSFKFRLSQLAKAVSGSQTVLHPRETVVYSVDELPATGGQASASTEFDGVAQSLYALETGIRLAGTLLTQFGAGTGVAVNGAIKAEMPVVDLMDKALGKAGCLASVLDSDFNLGKLIASCFDVDQLFIMFGPAAMFLAPVMVVAPVIHYFESQFNALGDQFNGRSRQQVTVTRANLEQLCPGGQANCYGVRQADIDGDGQLDTVSLVFRTEGLPCSPFWARVVYATGEVGEGNFCFPSPDEGEPNPTKMKFSLQGFADMNGEPGMEIFGRVYVNGDWYIKPLEFMSDKKDELRLPTFDGLTFDFSTGLNSPFGMSTFFASPDAVAGGFRCAKGSGGQPELVVWEIMAFNHYGPGDDSNAYYFSQVTFKQNGSTWEQVPELYSEYDKPLRPGQVPTKQIAAERAKDGCEGLGKLPVS